LTSYVSSIHIHNAFSHIQEEVNQQNHNLVTKATTSASNLRLLLVMQQAYLIFKRVLRDPTALGLQILLKMELYTLLNQWVRITALEDPRK
jgi:hypothetical protein